MSPTREQARQVTQRRVLDAAVRLFQERGFVATTIRDIAEASRASVGTVMAAGDKNDLLVRVFDTMIAAGHGQRGAGATPGAPGSGPGCAERIVALLKPFVDLFTSRQDLARTYASILASGSHRSSLFTTLAAQLVDEMQAAVTQYGCTPAKDAEATAKALYFAYVGNLFVWSARGVADPIELTGSLRATFAAICTCKE